MTAAHARRARSHTLPVRERRARGECDPVVDFLFTYYPYPISLLEKWHPGIGVAFSVEAGWENEFSAELHAHEHGTLRLDPDRIPPKRSERITWIGELLVSTRDRAPNFACHGMHEWAMVYQAEEVRHASTAPLRLPQTEIDALVRARPILCSHHDAFRFFAKSARPFNRIQPTIESRIAMEQPGCVHANMDLYKWAAKLMPWCGSGLLLDAFELALALRELDMRASPYDLRHRGLAPIPIETPDGRREYERIQRGLAARSRPVRDRLIAVCASATRGS